MIKENYPEINNYSELVDECYYWLVPIKEYKYIHPKILKCFIYYDDSENKRKYFGENRLWCYEGNDQVFNKYRVFGPILEPII